MGKGGRDEDSCNSVINKNKVKKKPHTEEYREEILTILQW